MAKDKDCDDHDVQKAIELEKLRLEYAAAAQTRRIQFWTMIFTAVMTVVTPLLLRSYHAETVETVVDARKKVREDIEEQSSAIRADAKKAVDTSSKAAEAAIKIEEKVDATNLQWKAYNTKKPDDMEAALEALIKVENMPPTVTAENKP